jgi:hypothetical protein
MSKKPNGAASCPSHVAASRGPIITAASRRLGRQHFIRPRDEDAADFEDRHAIGETQVVARRVQQARQQRPAQMAAVRGKRVEHGDVL